MKNSKPIAILHINLHREHFAEIAAGTKRTDYRDRTDYWARRLEGRRYDVVQFRNGLRHPSARDAGRIPRRTADHPTRRTGVRHPAWASSLGKALVSLNGDQKIWGLGGLHERRLGSVNPTELHSLRRRADKRRTKSRLHAHNLKVLGSNPSPATNFRW
jgi:hypothetical protein